MGQTNQKITFPYGNHYGWAITHRKGQKLICRIFPEKELIDNKYPCNDGGGDTS